MERAAAAGNYQGTFPTNCVALDSWANVWLKHQRNMPTCYYQDILHLAHGQCQCHKETSQKGVPTVFVPWMKSKENIDLFPKGFLWERGCNIIRGDDLVVRTPKGREIQVQMWGSMPYITKDELCLILSDLPEYHVVGRSGRPATVPTAARVAYAHVDLNHLTECMPKEDQRKIKKKYRSLPDLYYQDNVGAMITPERFDGLNKEVIQQPSKSQCAKLWEICSGSSSLSARARQKRVPHLPPIDLRYGWYTHRRLDQTLMLYGVLVVGVHCVHAAPNCALWGTAASNLSAELLLLRRDKEKPGLQFLALICFLQVLLDRHFLIESCGASKIVKESPLQVLVDLGLHITKLDQCMYGAQQENQRTKKNI